MKKFRKVLALTLCAAALVGASVMGTMAYLTDNDMVTNTFTVGNVDITLDETDVDNDSNTADNVTVNEVVRDKANAYNLLPGHTYTKDPIIRVDAKSEDCWVFVKLENGIDAYEAVTTDGEKPYKDIVDQIKANGWSELDGVTGVYYMAYTKNQDNKSLKVFQEFKIADEANKVTGWSSITAENTQIKVTGYAVQKDGFGSAKAAWDATFGAPATGGEGDGEGGNAQ